jgi:hypothetical protein
MLRRTSATAETMTTQEELGRRTVRKLDFTLLPFLALLFMLNSLDKSNIGNAETAGFTRDTGLSRSDINHSMAVHGHTAELGSGLRRCREDT